MVETKDGVLGGYFGALPGSAWHLVAGRIDELEPLSFRIQQRQGRPSVDVLQPAVLDFVLIQPALPPVQGAAIAYAERDRADAGVAGTGGRRLRPVEERDVGSRMAQLVRIEEVVGGYVVLVDGFLDQAQTEDSRVEVDVVSCAPGNGRDMVQTVKRCRVAHDRHDTYGSAVTRWRKRRMPRSQRS